jgi:hypothetical protein
MRRVGVVLAVALVAAGLAGCKVTSGGVASGTTAPSPSAAVEPAASSAAPSPSVVKTSKKPAVPALTCAQLRGAQLGSPTLSYNGYHDSIPLGDGEWSGEDGAHVVLGTPCGIGDLDGDGAADAMGVVTLDMGGSGHIVTLVVWRNNGGEPDCKALFDLGDRNPVQSIVISGQKATVVWLTRTNDQPMAVLNIRRTSIFKLSGATLTQLSLADVPYTP